MCGSYSKRMVCLDIVYKELFTINQPINILFMLTQSQGFYTTMSCQLCVSRVAATNLNSFGCLKFYFIDELFEQLAF